MKFSRLRNSLLRKENDLCEASCEGICVCEPQRTKSESDLSSILADIIKDKTVELEMHDNLNTFKCKYLINDQIY